MTILLPVKYLCKPRFIGAFLFYSVFLSTQTKSHEENFPSHSFINHYQRVCTAWQAKHLMRIILRLITQKYEYQIPMRDGKKLFTSVYVPKGSKSRKYPIMMDRTPYSVCAVWVSKQYKGSLGPSSVFAHDGFVFVYQDVRGRWMSEGIYQEMTPELEVHKTNKDVDEGTDTYDTIDWLLKNLP
jgi:predicted acyl esterase